MGRVIKSEDSLDSTVERRKMENKERQRIVRKETMSKDLIVINNNK